MKLTGADKAKRVIKWTATNAVVCAALWMATARGSIGCARIVVFMTWLNAVAGTLAALGAAKDVSEAAKLRSCHSAAPEWIRSMLTSVIMLIMVYNGWIWTAVGLIWSYGAWGSLYKAVKDYSENEAEREVGELKELDQSVFEGQPPEVTAACVDYDGLLKFGKNVANLRYTWASERWRGADWHEKREDTTYKPLTSLFREHTP
jgi:hypothetical protein